MKKQTKTNKNKQNSPSSSIMATCQLCEPFHPRKLHRASHTHKEHLQHHHDATTRIASLSPCSEEAKETLRLRLRGQIKHLLKTFIHRSQTSHTTQDRHIVTVPCTEVEFATLFSGLPFTFHNGLYSLDMGGTPALETVARVLGAGWDVQEEESHRACFVATRVNEMEYFLRVSCSVKDLVSLERAKDTSADFVASHYDQTHIVFTFHIYSLIFDRPTKESE